jgi:hypothetical protein
VIFLKLYCTILIDINLGYLFLYTDIKYHVKPVDKRKRSLDLNKTTRFQQHICQLRATKQNQTWNTVKTFHHERLRKNNCYLKWIDYNGSSRRLIHPHNILLELFQAIRGIQSTSAKETEFVSRSIVRNNYINDSKYYHVCTLQRPSGKGQTALSRQGHNAFYQSSTPSLFLRLKK